MRRLAIVIANMVREAILACRQALSSNRMALAAAVRIWMAASIVRTKSLMMSLFIAACALVICFCAFAAPGALQEGKSRFSVAWNIIQNGSAQSPSSFASEIVLTNNGDQPLGNRGWRLYFNFSRKIIAESVTETVRIDHVNGDLYVMQPQNSFFPLRSGTSRTFQFQTDFWVVKESDAPSGFYLVTDEDIHLKGTVEAIGDAKVGPIISAQQTMRTSDDRIVVPTALSRYHENLDLLEANGLTKNRIVPSPVVHESLPGAVVIEAGTAIVSGQQLKNEAHYLADSLDGLLGVKLRIQHQDSPPEKNSISLFIEDISVDGQRKTFGDHAYRLNVRADTGVVITGTDPTGVLYGIQSLRALLPIDAYSGTGEKISLGAVEIEDAPRFHYRGLHLDVARNFQQKSSVKRILELMALYKLNKFHFHLTDDEGWRLEIAGLPELTEVGGQRSHCDDGEQTLPPSFGSGPSAEAEGSFGSGFYSRQEFIEILQYAANRHIEVIPEIDLPGHARAAIQAMEVRRQRFLAEGKEQEACEFLLHDPQDDSQYESVQMWKDNVVNVCQESTYTFIGHVISDIQSMYSEAGLELSTMHLGGDEVPEGVWHKSAACRELYPADESGQVSIGKEAMTHFFERIAGILIAENVLTGAWEEVFLNDEKTARVTRDSSRNRFLGPKFRCYVWNNVWGWGQEDVAYRLANAGVNVVLCNATHLYFDLAYNKDPREPGYYWAGFIDTMKAYSFAPLNCFARTRKDLFGRDVSSEDVGKRVQLNDEGKKHILGIQGQLWGENLKGEERLEYMALPRLIALAERAWAKQPEWASDRNPETWPLKLQRAWSDFAIQLGTRELPRLDYLQGGFQYRIPAVGAVIEDGILKANIAIPGITIRYSTDGSEPDINSPVFTQPVRVGALACVRAFASNGRGGRPSTVREQKVSQVN
jgi:hexosaminidase